MIHPVILCGGIGSRLWPRSRAAKPKPFLPLVGSSSLFEATLERCSNTHLFAPPCIVTGAAHLEHVEAQLGGREGATIIVEPEGKNTAPAIALAALRMNADAVMLVCPSDHHIDDEVAFRAAAESAAALADQDWLVAFGIEATKPETGYGYIKQAEPLGSGFQIANFVEKPDLATAQSFLDSGGYSWNGGIFALRAGAFLDELTRFRPEMMADLRAAVEAGSLQGRSFYPAPEPFSRIKGESIDYAVMEGTDRAAMVPVNMGWSDIGNWEALRDARARDADGNSVTGKAELVDCRNVLVESNGPRVSAIGLEDIIIIVDGDEVLVTSSAGAQKTGTLEGAKSQ
ncbi:mannose-1-phosphate guanylyltransferase [Pontixanthobacter gangjinensis]|uniref:NTP transferase domain-containing protein n=1 Tax=Pontixanthobacter gangjinensis TaxID=1028742 RepID=A0A6I4SQJ8_9SPHN|nr:sugar phosphate nucleotidyltransferase [Pontixanthobacter gangjinensis]MXO57909.1 NTP transferase domain-containing protein [Pontixanthobacter gangjinensis]